MSEQNTAAQEVCYDVPRLLQQFEGLGHNCDFGMVQRAVGIEPFGLFRFAACSAADLGLLLQTKFQQFGEPADLWLEGVGASSEYRVKSRQCPSFFAHTKRSYGRDDPEVVLSAQIESIRFLKKNLIRDLSLDRRLFVYSGSFEIKAIREIARQLRTYGDNRLLWVKLANATHQPGSLESLPDGLMLGFVSRFGSYEPNRAPRLPVEEWVAVCAKAYRLWRQTEPPKAPFTNLISQALSARQCRWSTDPTAATRLLDELAPTGDAMFEHRLGTTEPTSVYRVRLPVAAGGTFTFSAWILIPRGFRGKRIVASLPGGSMVSNWTADLTSPGQWQRVWVTANLPVDASSISCHLIAEGSVGEVFHSTSWCLEQRNRPSGYAFKL